ncbi:MAG: response regulator transcription factor [Bacilli bacterium]|nr:response regulator transcription factor [Bacilli bacterium]
MKYNIAIIDDEQVQREYLLTIINSWKKSSELNIKTFHNAESFLFDYEENKDYDILLLDIEMDKINGIELAKKVRMDNERVQIIFITGFADYMSLGFDVSALHYLMKPVSKEKLHQVLDKAVNLLSKKEANIIIKVDGQNTIIKLIDIVYVESYGHYISINTVDKKEYIVKIGINKFAEELDNTFIIPHRSYIVNLKYVKSISKNSIILDDSKEISMAKNNFDDVNKAFINYYRGV